MRVREKMVVVVSSTLPFTWASPRMARPIYQHPDEVCTANRPPPPWAGCSTVKGRRVGIVGKAVDAVAVVAGRCMPPTLAVVALTHHHHHHPILPFHCFRSRHPPHPCHRSAHPRDAAVGSRGHSSRRRMGVAARAICLRGVQGEDGIAYAVVSVTTFFLFPLLPFRLRRRGLLLPPWSSPLPPLSLLLLFHLLFLSPPLLLRLHHPYRLWPLRFFCVRLRFRRPPPPRRSGRHFALVVVVVVVEEGEGPIGAHEWWS